MFVSVFIGRNLPKSMTIMCPNLVEIRIPKKIFCQFLHLDRKFLPNTNLNEIIMCPTVAAKYCCKGCLIHCAENKNESN